MSNSELSEILQRETTAAEPKFKELLALARNLMLSQSNNDEHATDHTDLIGNSWHARGADRMVRADIPKELPEINISLANAEAIEQFGRAILEEAFECLGQRGQELYDEYLKLDVDDTEGKTEICKELVKLIMEMSEQATFDSSHEDKETKQYSPFRLSPKIIGQHPNTNVNPTCLGKSILATSFFHKLGLPILHAGVVVSRNDSSLMSQGVAMMNVTQAADTDNVNISPNFVAEFRDEIGKHQQEIRRDDGFHATSYVQLNEQAWVQIDPNLNSNLLITTRNRNDLTEAYKELRDDRAKNLFGNERTLILGRSPNMLIPQIIESLRGVVPTVDGLEKLLEEPSIARVLKRLEDEISATLLNRDPDNNPLDSFQRRCIDQLFDRIAGDKKEDWLRIHIATELTKVFVDKDGYYDDPFMLEAFDRVATDKHYRKRRAADLYLVPFNVLLHIQSTYMLTPISRAEAHNIVSTGLPEYRIGMSVLSDVAAHYGDELPISSWLSYWPSIVSLVEHREQLTSDAQKQLAKTALIFFREGEKTLTPKTSADIIDSVLEEIGPRENHVKETT